MTVKLKSCPFCGSSDLDIESAGCAHDMYNVACGGCEAWGPTEDTKEKAIEKWNLRKEE